MAKSILVVEDEKSIQELITFHLQKEGYCIQSAGDGNQALKMIDHERVDLVVLDLMLPGIDGIEICKYIRQRYGYSVYVLMLTARGEELDRIVGIEVGADDYMVKPFSPRELTVRIKAAFRRWVPAPGLVFLTAGDLRIDRERYLAEYKGVKMDLTPKQFALLVYMMENKGKVCSREELLTAVWGFDYYGDSRTVDVHISQLRQHLTNISQDEIPIQTLRGIGYRIRSDG